MCLAATGPAEAYEVETHKAISLQATIRSSADVVLRESLGFREGRLTVVGNSSLTDWIGEGSLHADDWTYYVNHFHNALTSDWSQAGLGPAYSAILWGQTPNQGDPSWSWQNTRQYFLGALTSTQKADRDLALSMTFQGLGQLIHLIQDMASPAHTRNDPHLPWNYNYETLVKDVQLDKDSTVAQAFLNWINSPSLGPDPGWQTLARNELAPIPIARLVDTDLYSGANPDATIQPLMGLAEYTSANYFSEDRVFRENEISWRFPYPRRSSVTVADYPITLGDGTPVTRQYFRKDFHGDSGYRLATVGFLRDYVQRYGLDPKRYRDSPALDEAVYRDYAERLLPRAVSYSTALLDYFFRGKLEATIGAVDSEKLQLTAKNASSEPLSGGTLTVYGDYAGGERRPFGPWLIQVPVAPGGDLPSQTFSPDKPIPARYMVVFQGNLGEEKKDNPPGFGGAVIGKAAKYGGVMEELILFRTPNNTYDVYFRNANQVVLLGLSEDLPVVSAIGAAPAEVHWGADSNHFFVKNYEKRTVAGFEIGVPVYWIYKIDRPENSVSGDEPVQVKLRKTIRPPETPLPYGYRETWINREQWNSTGQMVYPYGMVFSTGYVETAPSEQEVLSEDLGNGRGLEIYALFQALVYEETEYVDGPGGGGWGDLGVSLIIQASTGAIVHEDPVSGSYKAQVAAAASHGNYAVARFSAWPRTWIVSWSDRDMKKRRWVTQLQVDDFYLTYDWTREQGYFNEADYFVENSVQTVLIENGQPKLYITPKQTYVEIVYDQAYPRFYPAALVPTMSSEKWLWVDEPDLFTTFGADEKGDSDILRRTQYLMSTETGVKQRVGGWTPPDSTQYLIAPKIREMMMLQPGILYAHGDPVFAIPILSGYESSRELLAQDLTSDGEKQKFVSFLSPDGQVDPAFTTAAPLIEDPDLRGMGRVRTDSYPPGFQAVLDALLNSYPYTKISWHVVLDPDLVPARRR